ncbi:hypothetical protein LARV_03836 [Longilinea arvoryzae]|uniref:Uncharacterized protein n=1 Tax=Longilinea arvoryzae TaxID=360412 RepID=A0A0K8MXV4_9CHLR|nr:hypothetical protein [Longilinea arvoryzae]GAP16040.1 hypothetical protein LARV_03836 [Longilinea arvoryzae]
MIAIPAASRYSGFMKRFLARLSWPVLFLLAAAAVVYFLFPYGIFPKSASPNCGPESWHWLDFHPQSEAEFIAYLREHELQYLNGSQLPRLEAGMNLNNTPMGQPIDYDRLAADLRVQRRLGYVIYSLTYTHPACDPTQHYTLRITSYGFASLYGCCGV